MNLPTFDCQNGIATEIREQVAAYINEQIQAPPSAPACGRFSINVEGETRIAMELSLFIIPDMSPHDVFKRWIKKQTIPERHVPEKARETPTLIALVTRGRL